MQIVYCLGLNCIFAPTMLLALCQNKPKCINFVILVFSFSEKIDHIQYGHGLINMLLYWFELRSVLHAKPFLLKQNHTLYFIL